MRFQIRKSVFETNSSSTHSIAICSKDTFEEWKAGKVLYDAANDTFHPILNVPEKELKFKIKEKYNSIKKDFYKDFKDLSDAEISHLKDMVYSDLAEYVDGETYDQFMNNGSLVVKPFITKNGDEIVAFGRYVYD